MRDVCPVCGNAVAEGASACPSCGFKLLGATQKFEPVSLTHDDCGCASNAGKASSLRVVRGPQKDAIFKLGDAVMTVGRSPQCDIFLNDMTVSRTHAVVTPSDGGHIISDERSFNGVWVNNENVESRVLEEGDIIQIGVFCLVYQVD